MKTNTLRKDEDRRTDQHETVKEQLRDEVHDEIKRESDTTDQEKAEIQSVAHELKHKAIKEVATTEGEISRGRQMARVSQVINYLFGIIYGLLGLLIALELMGARQSSGFKQFIDAVTAPLITPFKGLLPTPSAGNSQLMLSYIIGVAVYGLVHLALRGLLRVMAERQTAV